MTCKNGACDYENTLDRTLTTKRTKQEIRYAQLWAEIELPKLLHQNTKPKPEQVSNQKQQAEPPDPAPAGSAGKTTQNRLPDPCALRSADQINAKRKNDDENKTNKPYLQRYTPEEKALTTKDKPKRNPHKKWANLKRKINNITNPLKKHINDIPIRQYTKWAMYYRIAHEKEVRTQ
jgi:hypothetical protein